MDRSNGYPPGSRNVSQMSQMSNASSIIGPGMRGPHDPRRPSQTPSNPSMNQRPSGQGMSRAERFEDEKRRIIESCFSKVDSNGQLAESYITHIRITEDATHPSSPPPPDSAPDNKKPRIVIIAVRSTGRVRMHKARENNNGSFSIGKTWNLEDLSAIETYSNVDQSNAQKRQHQEWAGPVGFVVTIIKPYYWQALTPKEKDFFIASLVKIYRKYTKGQVPDLRGFEDKERDLMLGIGPPQPQPPLRGGGDARSSPAPPKPPFANQQRPSSQGSQGSGPPGRREMSNERFRPSPEPTSLGPRPPSAGARSFGSQGSDLPPPPRIPAAADRPERQQSPGPRGLRQAPSMEQGLRQKQSMEQGLRTKPSKEQGLRQAPSKERIRSVASQERMRAQSRDRGIRPAQLEPSRGGTPQRLTPQSSVSDIVPPRSASPDVSTLSISSRATTASSKLPTVLPQQSPERQRAQQRQPSVESRNEQRAASGAALFNSTVNRWNPATDKPSSNGDLPSATDGQVESRENIGLGIVEDGTRSFQPEPKPLPERKRPPLTERQLTAESMEQDLRPPPLSTSRNVSASSIQRTPPPEEYTTPPQVERMPGAFYDTPTQSNVPTPQPQRTEQPVLEKPAKEVTPMPAPAPDVVTPDTENDQEEQYRPGLGPMIKKKERGQVADKFRKAATAYNAFKPRAGGAGERLLSSKGEPDGINGVVPAPLRKQSTDDARSATPDLKSPTPTAPPQIPEQVMPTVEVTSPAISEKVETFQEKDREVQLKDERRPSVSPAPEVKEEMPPPPVPEPRRPKRRDNKEEKYLRTLGVDPRLLDGRGLEFESILSDFGWGANVLQGKQIEDLEADLRRELGRVEAGSWLGHLEQKDERVEMVDQMLDRAIAECDELDGLLTLYSVELGSLNEDIAFIEAQSQGLQVQTANQKILHTELQRLVETISITPSQLQPLKYAPVGDLHSLEEIESSLLLLYKAMLTIDPAIRSSNALALTAAARRKSMAGGAGDELASMNALQEKREVYLQESTAFCQRFLKHMDGTFASTIASAKPALVRNAAPVNTFKLDPPAYNAARANLWPLSPLALYAKEVNQPAWQTLMRMYHTRTRPLYTDIYRDLSSAWKNSVRKPTGEEAELLFTSVEKEISEGLSSTARKLTVKRSQTLAKTLRAASGDKERKEAAPQPGRLMPCEVFAGILDQIVPVMSTEQNFIVDFFHATTLENVDFADAVMAVEPSARRAPNLGARRLMEPDRGMARHVAGVMEDCFGFLAQDLKTLVEWAVGGDPLQGVGILTTLSIHAYPLHETSQEYLLRLLSALSAHLTTLFQKFVDEQIRAIEETKVKIKKRKGVIAFMKIFPSFAAAVETLFHTAATGAEYSSSFATQEVRNLIDDAYNRVNRAMWDSLKVIAKESPTVSTTAAGGVHGQQAADPEDKEVLNYHILLIENMNHYIEDVDERGKEGSVLAEWKARALMERAEHLDAYVGRVVRRPLGKILDFLEQTELLLQSHPPTSISQRPSHSRSVAKKLLAAHDAKEIRRGIDTLRKRIEKHFGDADEEALSRQLVGLVSKECERRYEEVLGRLEKVVGSVYGRGEGGERGVEVEWGREDVRTAFKR